ncbi:hypothetical protein TcasGA2_TC031535 [Tribolium castaneum]|uniref:Uncharacterized protein n=1 Tax=Tribolium castaneum TaxID=7070 RepID=A0A139WPA5_TRICA|nr:hypothetical protein TcasGA2_TC031535 [Tribolium castaneum]
MSLLLLILSGYEQYGHPFLGAARRTTASTGHASPKGRKVTEKNAVAALAQNPCAVKCCVNSGNI